jgi:hypothetical protein
MKHSTFSITGHRSNTMRRLEIYIRYNTYTWPLVLDKMIRFSEKSVTKAMKVPHALQSRTDPGERYNLIKREPLRARELSEKMEDSGRSVPQTAWLE